MKNWRIGIDVGGTTTDVGVLDAGVCFCGSGGGSIVKALCFGGDTLTAKSRSACYG